MSLKREIQNPNSPIGGFLRDVFPSSRNRALLAELHAALGAADPICLLDPDTPPWLRSYVGQAIDYRIRHHFQPSQADPIPMARDGIWAVTCQTAFNTDPRSACKIDPPEWHGRGCPGSQ